MSAGDFRDWEREDTVGYIWWCGDEECDCHQPVIERRSPNRQAGFPWRRVETLWRGTFHSDPDSDELATMRRELADECIRRGYEWDATRKEWVRK